MYSDLTDNSSLNNVGYPIAELADQGDVHITKVEGTGGEVTVGTVSEQLVYEIGDPAHYLTPDVDANFSQVQLEQTESDRVSVTNALGQPAPARYKVSLAFHDGYMATGMLAVAGSNAVKKARACGEMVLARLKRIGKLPARTNVEVLGAGDSLPGMIRCEAEPWEVVLRISAHDDSRDVVERFCRELAPLVTSGPAGVTGYTGARPKPHPVLAYWPTTIAKERIVPQVEVHQAEEWLE